MNKILNQSDTDFEKTLLKLPVEDRESLLRLVNRELDLEKQQLERTKEQLKTIIERKINADLGRYKENIRDSEMMIDSLQMKLEICNKQMNRFTSGGKMMNGSSQSTTKSQPLNNTAPLPNAASNDELNSVSTKLLIKNFEQISVSSKDGSDKNRKPFLKSKSQTTITSQRSIASSLLPSQTIPMNLKDANETSQGMFYKDVKLRKVGLPPDAAEGNYNVIRVTSEVILPSEETPRNSLYTLKKSAALSPQRSFDSDHNGSQKMKDKFYNPNKDIREAIQNEIRDLKLRKTNPSTDSQMSNFNKDGIALGKFNFTNEKILSSMNSFDAPPLSISRSMPFLSNISHQSSSIDEQQKELISYESVRENGDFDETDSAQDCFLLNWDPVTLLENLYVKNNTNKSDNRVSTARKVALYADVLLVNEKGFNRGWRRRFASISNNEINIFENQVSREPISTLILDTLQEKVINSTCIEMHDSNGIVMGIQFLNPQDCFEWLEVSKCILNDMTSHIVPIIDSSMITENSRKILIVDLGSCSVRAGILKTQATLPPVYFPHIAAISKSEHEVVQVGFEACDPSLHSTCNLIRPLKPDTSLEQLAFTSGTVEQIVRKVCSLLNIEPKNYVILLSLPHNVSESSRMKLSDVLLLRLNFSGVSMCGQSLLALHAYGEPTGVLIDIGHRTEILPVIHGIVQNAGICRSLYGGHLAQLALSHLLPFELNSTTDFFLCRYIMEKVCCVAENHDAVNSPNSSITIDLNEFRLPDKIPKSLTLKWKDRCLPTEGLFNPDIYSLDTPSLPKMIFKSVQACPVDFRRDLYQSICLSGGATQFPGLSQRLAAELKKLVPTTCDVRILEAPDRAHYSYVGACYVASSDEFMNTIVSRREWEDSRSTALKKWHL